MSVCLQVRCAAAVVASLLLASGAAADWPASGKFVGLADDGFNGTFGVRFLDLPSGDLAVAMFGVGGNSLGYSIQRISHTGDRGAGWPADGVVFGECGGTVLPIQHGLVVDDSGCVWHSGPLNGSRYSQLVNPNGILLPAEFSSWPTFTTVGTVPADAAPARGGSYIAAGGWIQRMTRAGTPAPGWPATGIRTGIGSSSDISAVGDGAGGAVLFSHDSFSGPLAQRIDANAIRHAGWPAFGVLLSNDAEDLFADNFLELGTPLIPSGPGAFIAAWGTPYQLGPKKVKLQRFLLDGTLDPAWPPGGLVVVATDSISGVTMIPDGLGGGHVLWYSLTSHTIRGTHVLANGQFAGPSVRRESRCLRLARSRTSPHAARTATRSTSCQPTRRGTVGSCSRGTMTQSQQAVPSACVGCAPTTPLTRASPPPGDSFR